MILDEHTRRDIIDHVSSRAKTFGGGKTSEWNPITAALSDREPMFAAGVDVGEVVDLVVERLSKTEYFANS